MSPNYWSMPKEKIISTLKTSSHGLTSYEAKNRLRKYGLNSLKTEKPRSAAFILFYQFKNPLILLLIAASIISLILKAHTDAIIILIMVFVSIALSFIQEFRSEKTLKKLRQKIAPKTKVMRDRKIKIIFSEELVPGDIVLISAGQIIPADLRLIQTENLQINESSITGESFPSEKNENIISSKNTTSENLFNIAYMGTYAIQGNGQGIVISTGKSTQFGKTASLLTKKEETEFEKGLRKFSKFIVKVLFLLVIITFLILSILKQQYFESLLFALALAIGISPELLPVILTINLTQAAIKMARKSVIVKKLISIEDLGNADIFCTDKTGTLTEGNINLIDFFNPEEKHDQKVLKYAYFCNTLAINNKFNGNPLDQAIFDFARQKKIEKPKKIIDEIPFDFKRRKMSVVIEENKNPLLVCKGSFEEILNNCSQIEIENQTKNINHHKSNLQKKFQEISQTGHKVLAVAYKKTFLKKEYSPKDEENLIFLGFLVFSDTPKKSAAEALATLEKLGTEIKILTGDNELITKTICQKLNFKIKKIILGSEIEKMTDQEFNKQINQANIFAKINPEHKLKIIKALKTNHTVGYLGDGINDAPALNIADVGISFKEAQDIAKESAQIILMEKNLKILAQGISEGRKTFGNTIKFIFITISSNFGNMLSVAIASIFLPFIPLLPSQILLLNILSDLPLLAIATDKVDTDYLNKPKHWNIKAISRFMIYFGAISTVFDLAVFAFLIYIVKADVITFRTVWFLESVLTEIAVIYAIRTRKTFFRSSPSLTLIGATILSIIITLIFVYSPINKFFDLISLPLAIIAVILGLVICYFVITEIGKKLFYKKFNV